MKCETDPDGRIWVTAGTAARLSDCTIEPGTILSVPIDDTRPHMDPTEQHASKPASEPVALPAEPVPAPEHAHEAHVEAPASPVSGSDVVAVAGQNPLLAFGLALVALFAGGGAGWRWWSKRSEAASELARLQAEQSHELALRQLELSAGSATVQPPPCHAKQLEVEAKLSAIVADVASVQTDVATLQRAVRELRKNTKGKA